MTTQEIANMLVSCCRKADWETAHNTLYAEDAVSIEPYATTDFEQKTAGLQAIRQKTKKFDRMVEQVHSLAVSDPLVAGNTIAIRMEMDVTMKGQGRMRSSELCLYQVKDGKIVSEQFFV